MEVVPSQCVQSFRCFFLCCFKHVCPLLSRRCGETEKRSGRCYLHKIVQREEMQKPTALLIYVVSTHFCACVLTF